MRYKRAWIAILVLAILSPLGLLAVGEAWGEWDSETIKKIVGYVPDGMARAKEFGTALFKDYTLPGLEENTPGIIFGTIISAVIGAGLAALATLIITRLLGSRKKAQ